MDLGLKIARGMTLTFSYNICIPTHCMELVGINNTMRVNQVMFSEVSAYHLAQSQSTLSIGHCISSVSQRDRLYQILSDVWALPGWEGTNGTIWVNEDIYKKFER